MNNDFLDLPFSQPVTDLIRQRYSCRTYKSDPIDPATCQQLEEVLTELSVGPFGSKSRFMLAAATEGDRKALRGLGTYGFIRGATGFIIGVMDKKADHNHEDWGYLMELAILYATGLGLGTCWLGGTFTKSTFARKIGARGGELVPAVASTGYPADRESAAGSITRMVAGAKRRIAWERLFFDGGWNVPLTAEAAGAYAVALEMVRLGPSASNKQPWRIVRESGSWHLYLWRTPRYIANVGSTLRVIADMQRLDMGIAMCHFELAARASGLNGQWVVKDPRLETREGKVEYAVTWQGAGMAP
jgi:nitroreductase